MITRNRLTKEYLFYPLLDENIEVDDSEVYFAFMPVAEDGTSNLPVNDDWKLGNWITGDSTSDAAILIGPNSSNALSVGLYVVYIRIDDTDERPIRRIDYLQVI